MSAISIPSHHATFSNAVHFSHFQTGPLQTWIDNTVELPGLGKIEGKLFLKEFMGLTGCEISINALPPGEGMPIFHRHIENEEIYLFIHGQGQMQIDGEIVDVGEGSVVRIAPEAQRTWRNNASETLVFLVLQVKDGSLRQYGVPDAEVPNRPVVWR